ncbi:cation:proton antiporter subunit C [Rhodococcus sp. HNM0569]|uniref:sodium:proton antiporter n=1 Tax=Rhodococcus sp. HNM0569 TaxID=2716340 RepID=UPI00146B48B9|nr:cation:proton antiporter subunit C [Rhodococcus sp. HNM0569]NLU83520.1 cation:proton antiporter subunit C [Rhodococcus sp. HNM0569]
MSIAVMIGVLVAGGVYLILQRGMVRIVFGFVLISHAANLTLMVTGVTANRDAPLLHLSDIANMADPLPHAFTLTAIVISFAITVYMLTLAAVRRGRSTDDDTGDDEADADEQEEQR